MNYQELLAMFLNFVQAKKIQIISGLFFVMAFYLVFLSAPGSFKAGSVVSVPQGSTLHSIAKKLKDEGFIRSTTMFESFVVLYGGEKHLIPTEYFFEKSLPVYEVARRISRGEHGFGTIKITIPEGFTNKEMAQTFALNLPHFDIVKFLELAQAKEGYLFPDTYFFQRGSTEEDVIKPMSDNYEKKIKDVRPEILASGKTEKEIIIMASIIEREANGDEDRSAISGILWKRISIGMPLQADAAPVTYEQKGLPKNPIGNPGLEAIKAAIYPEKTAYLYYLHDKDGNIHYAKSFDEHRANRAKYLR